MAMRSANKTKFHNKLGRNSSFATTDADETKMCILSKTLLKYFMYICLYELQVSAYVIRAPSL